MLQLTSQEALLLSQAHGISVTLVNAMIERDGLTPEQAVKAFTTVSDGVHAKLTADYAKIKKPKTAEEVLEGGHPLG